MKPFLRIVIFLAFILSFNVANATHILGGNFEYECIGNDSFKIKLKLYRDCTGINSPDSATIRIKDSCGLSMSLVLQLTNLGGTEVSNFCPTSMINSSCNGGSLPGVQQYLYEGVAVFSSNACSKIFLSWSSCCRNNVVNLSGGLNTGVYISAEINRSVNVCNRSPEIPIAPFFYACQNDTINYNLGAYDLDGNRLIYSLVPSFKSVSTVASYTSGYSGIYPFGSSMFILLDSNSGKLTFIAATTGFYALAIRIDEYDNSGNHLGYIIKDIGVFIQSCNNSVPKVGSITNFSGDGVLLDSNSIEVCIGDTIDFDIYVSDSDLNDTISIVSNIQQVLGSSANVSIVVGNPAKINVSWTPVVPHEKLHFVVRASDNSCSIPGVDTRAFSIIVVRGVDVGKDQIICSGAQTASINARGGTSFVWSVLSGDPINNGVNFSCDTCKNVIATPGLTTTYILTSNMQGGCVNQDTITIDVAPDFTFSLSNDTVVCQSDSVPLNVVLNQASGSYSYKWFPSEGLTSDTTPAPVVLKDYSNLYYVTVESSAGCRKIDSVNIKRSAPFPRNSIIVSDTILCLQDSLQLDIKFGEIRYPDNSIATTGCIGTSSLHSFGTGSLLDTTSTDFSLFAGAMKSVRCQMLYPAHFTQQLAGNLGGQIKSIAFDVGKLGSVTSFKNLTVKIGSTNNSDLVNAWEDNLLEVVFIPTYNIVLGWNTITFQESYSWDGSSNLVIELCFDNQGQGLGTNSFLKYTYPYSSLKVRYQESLINSVCEVDGLPFKLFKELPNLKVDLCTGVDSNLIVYNWIQGDSISDSLVKNPIVRPITPSTYKVVIQDTGGFCTDTISHFIDVVTRFDPDFSFKNPSCLSDGVDTAKVKVGGGAFSGNGIIDGLKGVFNPKVSGAGVFAIKHMFSGNCASDTIINIKVLSDTTPQIVSPDVVCSHGDPVLLKTSFPGVFYVDDIMSGDTFHIAGRSIGKYRVTFKSDSICVDSSYKFIRVVDKFEASIGGARGVCNNDSLVLSSAIYLYSNDYTNTWFSASENKLKSFFSGTGIVDSDLGIFDGNGLFGYYVVSMIVSDSASGMCTDTSDIKLRVVWTDYSFLRRRIYYSNVSGIDTIGFTIPNSTFSCKPIGNTSMNLSFVNGNRFTPSDYVEGSWEVQITHINGHGCVAISKDTLYIKKSIGVLESLWYKDVEIYPSPAKDHFNVAINEVQGKTWTLNLMDITGAVMDRKTIERQNGQRIVLFNTSDLSTGVYFLNVSDGIDQSTFKVMVE